jgi:hypothetical protein
MALTLILGAFVLGLALLIYNSTSMRPILTDLALLPLTLSIALCGLAAVGRTPRWFAGLTEARFTGILTRLVLIQIVTLTFDLGKDHLTPVRQFTVFAALAGCALLLYAGMNVARGCGNWWFHGILALHLILGIMVIRGTPDPHIDVFNFQQGSAQALLEGRNPYTATFPNLYGPHTTNYPPGFLRDGRVDSGFVYPPLSLLLSLPGYLLGDCRYSQLMALILTALLLRAMGGSLVALMFLTQPRIFFILRGAYTEPFVVLLLALVVYAHGRWPRLTPYLLGLLFAVKQYMVLALPAAFLLLPKRGRLRFAVLALLAGSLVTLPFLLWNPAAFLRATILFNLGLPFRLDSLSYPAMLARRFGLAMPFWPSFVALPAGMGAAIWKHPRSAGTFALAVGFGFLLLFPLSKAAFWNYYFFAGGALSVAIASSSLKPDGPLCHNRQI